MAMKRNKWDRSKIRALRYHLDMTQAELAGEMGTRQQTISEWEVGLYEPRGASVTLLTMIAERAGFRYQAEYDDAGKE
jgi:DNA-binding transcriptional regulator YiaG